MSFSKSAIFSEVEAYVEVKSAAYISICEHFDFRPNKEIGKKSDFQTFY